MPLSVINWDPSNFLIAMVALLSVAANIRQAINGWVKNWLAAREAARAKVAAERNAADKLDAAAAMATKTDQQTKELAGLIAKVEETVNRRMDTHAEDDLREFNAIKRDLDTGKQWMEEVGPIIKRNGNGYH